VLELSLDYLNIHTIGGLVTSQLRHLPGPGESVVIAGYRWTVEAASEKGIKSIIAEPA
jgi:CBS domain containing-hemolysin-like protein